MTQEAWAAGLLLEQSTLTELLQKLEVGDLQTGTATLSNVGGSGSSVTLAAANTARRALSIFNDSTVALYVKMGAAATTSSFTAKVLPSYLYELPQPIYTGIVTGLWDSATGNARVTEQQA